MVEDITFGAWLKRRRRQLDLTQKGLAFGAGCSVGTIRKIEADERRPSRQLATLLAQNLDIPAEQREPFIAFARAEPYTADVPFPILAPAEGPMPVLPVDLKEAPAQPVKHNLPSATTPFLGRDKELAALHDLLVNPEVRLITIIGPGGMGKTRLALACAELHTGTRHTASQQDKSLFPHGVFIVSLAPLSDSEQIVPALAAVLDFPLEVGEQARRTAKQQIFDYLREKQMLLLLDNFEHLLDAAKLVADLLQAAPKVQVLTTSRERLQLYEEHLYPIQGLEFPEWETVEDAAEFTATKLFLQSAQRVRPNFTLAQEDLTYLTHICRQVEGMPLGLELAAAWVDMLSLADIAAEIQQSLDFLATEMRNMPARQRSMRATFDYSWRKLDKKEQSVFAQLSIFRGGFSRTAGQAVTGATLRELSQLVNKSFILFSRKRDRYQVHELLRQYGADKLGQDSELERTARDRHSAYYCQTVGRYTGDLKGARQQQALTAIEADLENVRLAWNRAVTRQDLAAVGTALEALYRFYWGSTYLQAGINDFEKAVAILITGEVIGARGILLGRLLAVLGWFYSYWYSGISVKAIAAANESLNLLRRLGAREETLMPLLCLTMNQASLEESDRLLRESLILAREFNDQWASGDALLKLGQNAHTAGDYEKAEQQLREAVQQFRQTGDKGGIIWALNSLSVLAGDRGRYGEALTLARKTMALVPETNRPEPGFYSLGRALYDLGAYEEAEAQFQQGLTFLKELGLRHLSWLFELGNVALCTGDYARAYRLYQESLAGGLEFDDLELVVRNHDALGRLYRVQGSEIQAREHSQTALRTAISLDGPPILLASIATVAELLAQEGDLDYAALLAMLITNHPASQAKIKERADHLLTRLETELSCNELANIRERRRPSDLDSVAAQLLVDLESP